VLSLLNFILSRFPNCLIHLFIFVFGLCVLRIIFISLSSNHLWEGIRGVAGNSDPHDSDGGSNQCSSPICVSGVPTQWAVPPRTPHLLLSTICQLISSYYKSIKCLVHQWSQRLHGSVISQISHLWALQVRNSHQNRSHLWEHLISKP
jgi:hypothetical protein